jgi:hypothetical protein
LDNKYLVRTLNKKLRHYNMKNIYLTITAIAFSAVCFGQNVPIDFETGGNGASWTWTVFENTSNPPLEIIANPDPTGANTSCTVAKFTALQTGQPWAGCESQHGADLGLYTLSATNSTITILVWKPVISDVGIKLVNPSNGAMPELKIPNTLINQWEEITFDFSAYIAEPVYTVGVDQIVIFPDFDLSGRTQDNVCYFDHVYGSGIPVVNCCAATSSSMTISNCLSYTGPSGTVYTSTGVYADTIANTVGCDSIISIDLTINEVDISTSSLSGTISSGAAGTSTYQWLDCDNSYAQIAGEVNQSYVATTNGNYAVEVTTSGCVDTSACVAITDLGINELEISTLVYPNPTKGTFTVKSASKFQSMQILNIAGQVIRTIQVTKNETVIDLSDVENGVYFLNAESDGVTINKRILKQ